MQRDSGQLEGSAMTWKTRPDGNIAVAPVAGWQIASFAGMGVVLRLDFLKDAAALQTMTVTESDQFVLNAPQALELAEAPRVRAEAAMLPPQNGGPAN